MIPIDRIKPCRWGTGIRDKEKFEQLKESIKSHGLDDKPHVFPLKNGMFEPFIGDHRILASKELGWKEIPCIVEHINEQEAMERCVGNNTTHADYDSVRLENLVFEMWNTQKYPSKAQLGSKIRISDTWVGLLIRAKELREKSKLSLDASISTRRILDTDILQNEEDKIALLKLVKDKKIKQGDIKEYAEFLSKASDESKKLIFEGVPLAKISEYQPKTIISKSKKTYIKTPTINLSEIYKVLNGLQDHIALIKDPEQKKEALNYIKFYTGLFLQILCKEGLIHNDFFESVVRKELDIDKDMLHHFTGLNTQGIDWWLKGIKNEDEEE